MSKKSPNKKDIKNEKGKRNDKASLSYGSIFFIFSAVIVGLASYYTYKMLTTPPEMPKLDLDYWWGTYPMNPKQDLSIRPYRIEFSDVIVNDLKERLLHRRPFAPPLEDVGFTYGFNTAFLTRVLDYWQKSYDFKDREKFLNQYSHYITNIQGLDIHYMHVKPKVTANVKVVPLLMLHGWPGSIREFYGIIPKLTTPRAGHNFVFEIIAPSLPGYGFSQAATRPGLGALQTAVIMRNLMQRLGFERYYVQGGDWGSVIGAGLATLFPRHVRGFHTNMPAVGLNTLAGVYTALGSFWPNLLEPVPELQARMYPWWEHFKYILQETGYMHIQATKPDTVGVALTDSPAGLAAYILEKFSSWTNRAFPRAADGNLLAKYQLTDLLDNVMIYWATNTITSSMRFYKETLNDPLFKSMDNIPTDVPTWGIKFKHELSYQPDALLRLKYRNYLHSTVVEDGGHFAALENPALMADDIFRAVDTFIQFHEENTTNPRDPQKASAEVPKTIYNFTVKDIRGRDVKLDKYKGHVCIIVNVASQCGLTDTNYQQLNELYDKYSKDKGLRILAFPCNQFNNQEPGSSRDILDFVKQKGVKFDLFEKIEVNGANAHPLWKFLKSVQSGTMGDFVKWNFSKFIVDRNGVPVERFGPTVNPLDLETYLAKYW